jgi:hypothetical protein
MSLLTSLNRSWRYKSCLINQHSPWRSRSIFAQGRLPTVRVRELRGSVPFLALIAALILLSTFPPAFADAEAAYSLRSVLSQFGFSAEHLEQVEHDAIVSVNVEPALPNELTAVIAMRLPIRISEFSMRIRSGINIIADPAMTEYGEIDPVCGETNLERAAFSRDEDDEAARLFRLQAGTQFNLSAAEIASLRQRLGNQPPFGRESLTKASAAYRMMLAGRLRAYCEGGLDSLAEYERSDGLASWPGKQLRGARATLPQTPGLAVLLWALNEFPRALPSTINQHLFWKKTEVNGRPTFILAHVLLEERQDSLAFVLREFYIGHSYNILQQIGIALPQGEGSVVFALNSTITDAISGMFSGVARAIGQRRAREALEAYFDGIRRSVGDGSPPNDTRR